MERNKGEEKEQRALATVRKRSTRKSNIKEESLKSRGMKQWRNKEIINTTQRRKRKRN